jgi:hypothetical protein
MKIVMQEKSNLKMNIEVVQKGREGSREVTMIIDKIMFLMEYQFSNPGYMLMN